LSLLGTIALLTDIDIEASATDCKRKNAINSIFFCFMIETKHGSKHSEAFWQVNLATAIVLRLS
jgi:hypothetical protein